MHEKETRNIKKILSEPARVRIGKKGLSEGAINEIHRLLEKEGIVKVKILKTALKELEVEEVATEVSRKLNAEIIDVRGHTFTLKRKK
ncbi:MAG: YhbY family RNA-binding protein [Desulfurococcaceae archaeon TW002]